MITEQQLYELEKLIDRTSDAPWVYDDGNEEITSKYRVEDGKVGIATLETDYSGYIGKEQEANLDFIIEARNTMPELIAEVYRLRRLLKNNGISYEVWIKY